MTFEVYMQIVSAVAAGCMIAIGFGILMLRIVRHEERGNKEKLPPHVYLAAAVALLFIAYGLVTTT